MLNGTFGSATFQVGANVGETITVGLSTSMRTTAIGRTADYVNGSTQYVSTLAVGQQGTGVDGTNALASGDLNIQIGSAAAVGVVASVDNSSGAGNAGRTAASAYSKVEAINASAIPNLTAAADTTVAFDFVAVTDTASTYTMTVNGQGIYTTDGNAISGTAMAAQINANAAATGVTATYDSANTRMVLNAVDGRNITVSQTASAAAGFGQGLTATTAGFNNTMNDALTARHHGGRHGCVERVRGYDPPDVDGVDHALGRERDLRRLRRQQLDGARLLGPEQHHGVDGCGCQHDPRPCGLGAVGRELAAQRARRDPEPLRVDDLELVGH